MEQSSKTMRKRTGFYSNKAGVTLLEILMGMLILALVSGGIFTAFVFGRRVNYRSESELMAYNAVQSVLEQLRLAVQGASPGGLPQLAPGIYVDQKMGNAGPFASQSPAFFSPAGSTPLAALNLPADFQTRYQTDPGTAANFTSHGDGIVMVVEGNTDLDGDGFTGLDFNADGQTDEYRVRLWVKKTTPNVK